MGAKVRTCVWLQILTHPGIIANSCHAGAALRFGVSLSFSIIQADHGSGAVFWLETQSLTRVHEIK